MTEKQLQSQLRKMQSERKIAILRKDNHRARQLTMQIAWLCDDYQEQFGYVLTTKGRRATRERVLG